MKIQCLTFAAIMMMTLASRAGDAATQQGPRKMTDQELQAVRDGFDQRVAQAFAADEGQPLKRAAKRPALYKENDTYVRQYSWSIVDYATRCFLLNEQLEEANAALVENARHYFDHPADINNRDSFHWHSEMLCRLIEMFGPKGTMAAGRLTEETRKTLMEQVWLYAKKRSNFQEASTSDTWHLDNSENHHSQDFLTCWHWAKLAKDMPDLKDRKYDDGHTVAEHYAAWTRYIKEYCAQRGRKGMNLEIASDGYNVVWMKGFLNVYDFAEEAALKSRVGAMLDLYWALWAQEQIDGVRGGGKTRIYQSGPARQGHNELRGLAWFYFGIGKPVPAASPLMPMLTSRYRPPLVVIDLALDVAGRGRYEVRQRPLGLAVEGHSGGGDARLRPDDGGTQRYSWCSPDFILGCLMYRNRPRNDWVAINAQNRWHGAIFAGDVDARIVPQVRAADERTAYNSDWAVQSKGTLICQKAEYTNGLEMRVWFARSLLPELLRENGWVFVKAPRAYAAVRVVSGDADWDVRLPTIGAGPGDGNAPRKADAKNVVVQTSPGSGVPMVAMKGKVGSPQGAWLLCTDDRTPVIMETASAGDFTSYEAFRKAVAALPVSFRDNVLTWTGLSGERFTFHANYSQDPTINGKPVEYSPPKAYDSPFIQGDWDGGVVTIAKDGRRLVLDFAR